MRWLDGKLARSMVGCLSGQLADWLAGSTSERAPHMDYLRKANFSSCRAIASLAGFRALCSGRKATLTASGGNGKLNAIKQSSLYSRALAPLKRVGSRQTQINRSACCGPDGI